MDPDSSRVSVAVSDGRGRPVRAGGLARWLASVAPPKARGAIAIALVSDARMRVLNLRYRRKGKPTDVLSFPTEIGPGHGSRGPSQSPIPRPQSLVLGDIVIATGVAKRQALEAGHSYAAELRVLALHGLLHLIGYDHDDRGDAGRMARAERRLRRKGGLKEGLIDRAEIAHSR